MILHEVSCLFKFSLFQLFDSIAGCKRVTGENDNSHPGGLEEVCSRKFVQGAKKQKQYQRKVSFEEGTLIFSNDVMQKLSMRPTLDDLQPNPVRISYTPKIIHPL